MESIYLTIQETAQYLNVPTKQIYNLAKLKSFPAKKIGKHWRIHRPKLDEWAAKCN